MTDSVKSLALAAGFAGVGIAPAGEVADGPRFAEWLRQGRHATMGYLEQNVELRLRPDRLVSGARSVICLAVGYAPPPLRGGNAEQAPPLNGCVSPCSPAASSRSSLPYSLLPTTCDLPSGAGGLVARYARGRDYHKVLKRRCHDLMDRIRLLAPTFEGRAFVDSAPVLERSLAAAAGVGWIGRNCCLVVPGLGSYVLLCEIICNLPLRPDGPLAAAGCTGCDACVRACPTGALSGDGLDARRCVSYLTVEHRGPIDPALWPDMGRRLVGCDACQEACPHNREACGAGILPAPQAKLVDILRWSAEDWGRATRGSAARRVGWDDTIRNAIIAAGNSGGSEEGERGDLLSALRALEATRPEMRDLIRWAVGRLDGT